jgi:hypothetical protein
MEGLGNRDSRSTVVVERVVHDPDPLRGLDHARHMPVVRANEVAWQSTVTVVNVRRSG